MRFQVANFIFVAIPINLVSIQITCVLEAEYNTTTF